jgi:hypothetical protein
LEEVAPGAVVWVPLQVRHGGGGANRSVCCCFQCEVGSNRRRVLMLHITIMVYRAAAWNAGRR